MSKLYSTLTAAVIIIVAAVSSYPAIIALAGGEQHFVLNAGFVFGPLPFMIDALSGFMILIINFTVITCILYGRKYLEHYHDMVSNINLHLFLIIVCHIAMLLVCTVQSLPGFLVAWEIMAISSFLLVIFEYWKKDNLKAGLNYLIQSHIGVLFLTVAFIWVIVITGSSDFTAIKLFSQKVPVPVSITLFILLFIGFGFKAGFVPFHTWLPYAHPAAPAHISGMMSGVIIKLGIFGILRVLLLIKSDFVIMGSIILIVSMISGLYGVMLAIIQHNLKKLLAYHSIENIGIIGIGIGMGTLGIGLHNNYLAVLGFAGGILHILNHSLFKSLLFYGAGSVYLKTHTLNIEKLGGLVKSMPKTSAFFLIPALAICGLPPFNGFVSEFLIYSGLFTGLKSLNFSFSIFVLLAICSLVIIGGLAILCFTKAFGIVFLGSPREKYPEELSEVPNSMLFPKFLITFFLIGIGLYPKVFLLSIQNVIGLFVPDMFSGGNNIFASQIDILSKVGLVGGLFLLIILIVYSVKKIVEKRKSVYESQTWGCGYVAPTGKLQYTASSFVKSYVNLIEPVLSIKKNDIVINEVFPKELKYESSPYDKIEYYLIDKNIKLIKKLLFKLYFLQNGKIQFYILYGLFFILFIILYLNIEFIISQLSSFLRMF
ncbi:MAG: proton-conducting transporter membrane subunit [Bacteroidota bacterium]|nr:proton-conducting transporter membrane subunit [Bacteroidota bacterium]